MKDHIDVAAAIILKDGKVFAARRGPGLHMAGYWEFPGGKLEAGESPEACLSRELHEELGVKTLVGKYVGENLHDYGSKLVRLIAYQVDCVDGEFQLLAHDDLRWLGADELDSVVWAPADIPLVELCHNLMMDHRA